ncbi:MAG: hypothetical protein QF629_08875 [Alphaproteobacteria bacterium]|jgi:hypothetical protein|nr:hypothetical protein [Alphaproteobacteria bacterium]MDP7174479.1 hypothetical protein [Alphaproteobacteria bacterium]HJN21201.1 hypothetical protein [Alphaproteobacteria bacterium]
MAATITDRDVYHLAAPGAARPRRASHFVVSRTAKLLVRLLSEDGIEGVGQATSHEGLAVGIEPFKSGVGDT